MNIATQILEAFGSMLANKLRSGLTMLGIIIGVASVVSMLAIGKGAQTSITAQVNSIGSNLIYVSPGAENIKNPRPLTLDDANALADPVQAPSISAVAATISGQLEVSHSGESTRVSVIGVTPSYQSLQNIKLAEGDFISDNNLTTRASVAVLGYNTATKLYGSAENVTGQQINIAGQIFRIAGVMEKKGGSGFGSSDDRVIIPLTTGQIRLFSRTNAGQVDQIMVQARESELADQAGDEITQILTLRHRTKYGEDDFTLLKQQDLLSAVSSITGILTVFLGGIGGISLLVGGIGIMNIMLVSVSERTREIGLRKALGARRRDILTQFLLESATMSMVGGLMGVALAYGISRLIAVIAAATGNAFEPLIGWDAVALATLFSAFVGLFFGIYPANRAASLVPVEALRSE
jgi:putative ABC transport system permease protein